MSEITAYIGLGSNLENPREQVELAFGELDALPDTRLVQASPLYLSAPVGPPGQPDYINAAARLTTALAPLALLDALQAIEQAHRRVRLERWGPRTLDLDLLLYGDAIIDLPRLQVPHPRLGERSFVLAPLLDLDSNLSLPKGPALASLLARSDRTGLRRLNGSTT